MKRRFLLAILLCWPFASMANVDINTVTEDIVHANDGDLEYSIQIDNANRGLDTAKNILTDKDSDFEKISDNKKAEVEKQIKERSDAAKNPQCDPTKTDPAAKAGKDERSEDDKAKALEDAKKKYEDAKATEQSLENRTLTALSTAATGIGGMELAMGLAQQSADKAADESMAAYIATMRCTYGEGKQVKAGPDEIELPGGNSQELMNLRAEYFALAADLKERKEALGMQPGIESEEILDKAATGLYDDENIGITSSAYASLYRAQMTGSEEDQAKIDDERKASKNRVLGGAIAAGAGVVVGVAGNALINGELGKKIKEGIANKKVGKETQALLKKEADALDDLRECLKDAGVQETDKLTFSNFYPSVLSVKNVDCKNNFITMDGDNTGLAGRKPTNLKASDMFADSTDADKIFTAMLGHIDIENVVKMIGYSFNNKNNLNQEIADIKNKIKTSIESIQKKFKDAEEADKAAAEKAGISIGNITGSADGDGIFSLSSLFNGGDKYSSYFTQPTATQTE